MSLNAVGGFKTNKDILEHKRSEFEYAPFLAKDFQVKCIGNKK